MKVVSKMFIYAKKFYRTIALIIISAAICVGFIYAKRVYTNTDFGKAFGARAMAAEKKLNSMNEGFKLCSGLCQADIKFMQSITFPEVMRYSSLKDGIEAESLRTLYVQFGKEYANFSIGLFQMKPGFAEQVEEKSKQLLAAGMQKEFQLAYSSANEENIRQQRVERLQDDDWQLVYLCAFISICNRIYQYKNFLSQSEKLQWYATVYNAGFDKTDAYISNKIKQDNFYLNQNMPGKKFKYAAIAKWFYNKATD